MQKEAPTFERIIHEFLSTLYFKLQRKYVDWTRYYYGTLKFRLFNQNQELNVEELGNILQLHIYGSGDVPKEFDAKNFWCSISDDRFYTATGDKASTIQKPCFWYAQKALAYTLFRQCDNTGVPTQRGLFFLHCMATNGIVNSFACAENYLGKVSRVIWVGGMIT